MVAKDNLLLVLDVGNSHTVLGLYDGAELQASWRVTTARDRTEDELAALFTSLLAARGYTADRVRSVILSSVVPPLNRALVGVSRSLFGIEPVSVDEKLDTGMPLVVDHPEEVGADRIVNSVAAYQRHGGPCLVVDFGTATTFDAVSADGEYLGGAIAPGLGISSEALFQRAARLPRVAIERPPRIVGKNTVETMQVGLFWGYVGLTEGLIGRMAKTFDRKPKVIATGGLAAVIADEIEMIDAIEDDLTLEGLRLIHERLEAK